MSADLDKYLRYIAGPRLPYGQRQATAYVAALMKPRRTMPGALLPPKPPHVHALQKKDRWRV